MNQILTGFLTGLISGGISCVLIQGGLLAASLSQSENSNVAKSRLVISFLFSKLFVHLIFGALLGYVGTLIVPSIKFLGSVQLVAAIYMLCIAAAMLDIHPFFRHFIITPPYWLRVKIRSISKSDNLFAPVLLGASTVLIPCGATQAIESQAVIIANPLLSSLVLGAFVLGTMPLFILFGVFFQKAKSASLLLNKLAVASIVFIALTTINSSAILLGSPVHFAKIISEIWCTTTFCNTSTYTNPSNTISIKINSNGFNLSNSVVKTNQKVILNLSNSDTIGCQQVFTIPKLNISQIVRPSESKQIAFMTPATPGTLTYSCGMGMYIGEISVIN